VRSIMRGTVVCQTVCFIVRRHVFSNVKNIMCNIVRCTVCSLVYNLVMRIIVRGPVVVLVRSKVLVIIVRGSIAWYIQCVVCHSLCDIRSSIVRSIVRNILWCSM
jgi:hypothetical protein